MAYSIIGLHHVTATVDQAQADLDFCVDALGLRLVKKTVNFDNHHVYHFYYATERGAPGTIWTTFPYHGHGVRVGAKGAGQITATSLSVPSGTLDFWKARLKARGTAVADAEPRFGEASVIATDPAGLVMELVATDRGSRPAWDGGDVDPGAAVPGGYNSYLTRLNHAFNQNHRLSFTNTGNWGIEFRNENALPEPAIRSDNYPTHRNHYLATIEDNITLTLRSQVPVAGKRWNRK